MYTSVVDAHPIPHSPPRAVALDAAGAPLNLADLDIAQLAELAAAGRPSAADSARSAAYVNASWAGLTPLGGGGPSGPPPGRVYSDDEVMEFLRRINCTCRNVVATAAANCRFDNEKILLMKRHVMPVEYYAPSFAAMMVRVGSVSPGCPHATILVFESGMMVCVGERNEIRSTHAFAVLEHMFHTAGMREVRISDVRYHNLVCAMSLGHDLNLPLLARTLDSASYDPSNFPGLIYRPMSALATATRADLMPLIQSAPQDPDGMLQLALSKIAPDALVTRDAAGIIVHEGAVPRSPPRSGGGGGGPPKKKTPRRKSGQREGVVFTAFKTGKINMTGNRNRRQARASLMHLARLLMALRDAYPDSWNVAPPDDSVAATAHVLRPESTALVPYLMADLEARVDQARAKAACEHQANLNPSTMTREQRKKRAASMPVQVAHIDLAPSGVAYAPHTETEIKQADRQRRRDRLARRHAPY